MNKFVFVILAFVAVLTFVSSSSATTACASGEHSAVISRVCTGQLGGSYSNADGNTPCCTYTGSGAFQIYPNRLCATSTSNTDFQRSEIQEFCEDGGNVYSCNNFANKGSQINCGASAVAEGTLATTYPGRHFPQPTRSNTASNVAASPSSAASISSAATASPVSNSSSVNLTVTATVSQSNVSQSNNAIIVQTLLSATGSPVSQTGSPNVSVSLSGSPNVTQTLITQSGTQNTGTAASATDSSTISASSTSSISPTPSGSVSSSIAASLTGSVVTGTNGSITAVPTGSNSSALTHSISVSANTTDTPPY